MTWTGPLTKPSRTARKIGARRVRLDGKSHERDEKHRVRRRDGYRCRFPRCGCRSRGLRLEVAHLVHKGAGGDISGARSSADNMILLCEARHQGNPVSWHKGTLRVRPLTAAGTNGVCAFDIREGDGAWWEVAREIARGVLGPLSLRQDAKLEQLARMVL